jgi:hypothetical protein
VATPWASTTSVEVNTSLVQLRSLKSRKVTLPVMVPKPKKLAVSRTAVPTGPPWDAVARTWVGRLLTTIVKVWHAGACAPSLAHTVVGPKLPACVGAPVTMPPGDMVIPGGREPLVTEKVAPGMLLVNPCAYAAPTTATPGGGEVMVGAA